MRVELRTRDHELLGHLDLQVSPAVCQQALMHTQVVLGPTVTDTPVVAVLTSTTKPSKNNRRSRKAKQA